jgi:uncharacterized LabA/DUF88 family protein
MIFIDAQNLFHGGKLFDEEYKIDLVKLVDLLGSGRDLIRSYYFDSFKPGKRDNKENFYTFLETNGFRVDAKPLRERGDELVEKGADIGLATEMIARGFNNSYEVAILVSGDNDFARAVRYVQDQGKTVEVASFQKALSSDLKRVADDTVVLDDISEEIQME